jgi:hypothetical protein
MRNSNELEMIKKKFESDIELLERLGWKDSIDWLIKQVDNTNINSKNTCKKSVLIPSDFKIKTYTSKY